MNDVSEPVDVDLTRLTSARPSRLADAISALTHPAVSVTTAVALGAWAGSSSLLGALGWGGAALLLTVVVPVGVLVWFVRTGRVSDAQVVRRAERLPLVAVAIGCLAVGAVVLWGVGAPAQVQAVVASVVATMVVIGAVTAGWKVSSHTAALSSTAAVAFQVLGRPALVVAAPLIIAAAWARVRGGRHSLAQVVVGILLGAAVPTVVFPWVLAVLGGG